jgi:predicted NAD/FAD-dependent oxidoreductase
VRVAIVGAGLSGLLCARALADAGVEVVVHEATERVGGRLCTRRLGDAVCDSGAQFFTVRSPRFQEVVDGWLAAGVAFEWCRGFGAEPDGHPRYAGTGGMEAITDHLASRLDVEVGRFVGPDDLDADRVVLAHPSRDVEWHRTIAVLARLDRAPGLPSPGALQDPDGPFTFVADNQAKGISPAPSITLHAGHELSARHWMDPSGLLPLAEPYVGGASIEELVIDRWPTAGPVTPHPEPVSVVDERTVRCGDWCGGPKVEGAALSGLAAARWVLGG